MKTLRVLQVLPYFPPHKGGLETVAEEYSRNLKKFGYAEVVNLTSDIGQSERDYQKDGYRTLAYPAFEAVPNFPVPKFWTKEFREILKKARETAPDVIVTHTRFFLASFLGSALAKFWNVRHVHVEHGSGYVVSNSCVVRTFSRLYDETLWKLTIRMADSVIAISLACAEFVNTAFGRGDAKVIYRGFDAQVGERVERHRNERVRIAFVGRLVSLKGVDVLLNALSKIDTPFACRIVGDGDERMNLEALAAKLGLLDSKTRTVEFVGAKSREEVLQKILPSTDVFVNPSLQEGLPTTVIEALLAGCAVVASDVGGTREIVKGKDLVLITPGNADDLLRGLRIAIDGFPRISGASKGDVSRKFDVRVGCSRLVAELSGMKF